MVDLALWPWGLLIISVLSITIGWLLKDILVKRVLKKKDEIIQSQEREYIKLAQKHIESREKDKEIIDKMEKKLTDLANSEKAEKKTVEVLPSVAEDRELIETMYEEIDRLKIENQKLLSVPKSLFVEKNKALKSELKGVKKKLKNIISEDEALEIENKRLIKKLRKLKKSKEHEVKIVETIDFKKLKKILKHLPVKRSRVTVYPSKKHKKVSSKKNKSVDD